MYFNILLYCKYQECWCRQHMRHHSEAYTVHTALYCVWCRQNERLTWLHTSICSVPFLFGFIFFFSFSFAFGFPLALKRRLATVQLLFLSVLLLAHSFLIVGNGIMLGFLVLPHATSAIARLSPGPGLVFMCDWLCEQTACRTAHIPKVKVKCCCGCC